jgi:hypothetical protein
MGKLKSIKINTDIKPLYDIEVQDNHNFVVNDGIVIKNSEQYLSRESLCVLSSINMAKFSTTPDLYQKELKVIGESINRFLDNVNTCELEYKTYATPHQRLAIEKLRRTGAGITNLAGWFFKNNVEYGSSDSQRMAEEFTKYYAYVLYLSSQKLGKEKGNFGLFNREKLIKSPYIARLMKEFPDLTFNSLRNVTTISVAPTGCTIKETKIQTDKGIKSFEEIFAENGIDITEIEKSADKQWFDLKIPLFAKDLNGNYNKITKLYYNGFDVISVLKFEDETQFAATPNHKVLVIDKSNPEYGTWKQLDELQEGDEIVFE